MRGQRKPCWMSCVSWHPHPTILFPRSWESHWKRGHSGGWSSILSTVARTPNEDWIPSVEWWLSPGAPLWEMYLWATPGSTDPAGSTWPGVARGSRYLNTADREHPTSMEKWSWFWLKPERLPGTTSCTET